ncbi:MAG TPA: MerR family DNA-binding transcriptional regulator [Candidatus Lokiarchaeia archaeon]|nr:MerR family DNA-binding transcriptional regulator [Candidatus Lokiarchaeia archaeon]
MSVAIIAGCLAIGAVASMLGVSTRTLRRWDKAGTMKQAFRTAGNHRRYERHAVLDAIQHETTGDFRSSRAGHDVRVQPRAAIYSRVSSTRQSLDGELDRQQATML